MLRKLVVHTCLVLAILTAIMWVASYWLNFQARLGPRWRDSAPVPLARAYRVGLVEDNGRMFVEGTVLVPESSTPMASVVVRSRVRSWGPYNLYWCRAAERAASNLDAATDPYYVSVSQTLSGPGWTPVVPFSIPPLVAVLRGPVRRHYRRKHGRCARCGYLLTGLTEPRCPECGTPIDSAVPSTQSAANGEPVVLATPDAAKRHARL
jgi:hypothetical protein